MEEVSDAIEFNEKEEDEDLLSLILSSGNSMEMC